MGIPNWGSPIGDLPYLYLTFTLPLPYLTFPLPLPYLYLTFTLPYLTFTTRRPQQDNVLAARLPAEERPSVAAGRRVVCYVDAVEGLSSAGRQAARTLSCRGLRVVFKDSIDQLIYSINSIN